MMNSKTSATVSLASLIVLISGCATDPLPPSLPSPQFIVIVKGDKGPLEAFEKFVDQSEKKIVNNKPDGCTKTLPPIAGESATKSDVPTLAYKCTPQIHTEGLKQLDVFTQAYGNSTASLLEMKITTASSCIARTCYGGALRLWYSSPPCRYPC